ncbi:MDR family MFS transporter [Paraburkholderia caballeronis]|uniref:MFS-type drug efflux transporter P55 n=1 Tax=Paraburkholderia caballeronis TaxID=416943 RepID=A0A1H7R566_9BURK|nr:MDR family MFS transporter [Paraburkholderia caballeronis]PXW23655.1 EmrB/QacA subfamily drug resistance transporter [Paraburkholderia caballeronis]PXW98996.1 EmrB/QacA subfamily drug resistance transporter [Paraburkholderia caballeronis]RAJ96202.1 EmrB/QacA subfamily drug resistance transporter [Paraburkholderia caballeronis]TDV14435.1 EmrB/QacA subfamily drug resistance transporter [Paraburkholderia caballeronis]TDV15961.1 EmrB/QacA subfamily drug resistance transporter [Paraburkholderia 
MSPHPKTSRPLVVASVMAAMAMVAIEATIVSTAMPQIVTQLGGLRLYSWVFSSFLLAQTAMTVVFGKLADLYGRKPVMLAGIAIFLVGSVLAGYAWSMPAMIVFRLIQGVGAGAIQPITLTIVGDLYPVHERGKVQGWLASVWALSAVLGPMAGGFIIRDLSWSWIFWINVPIGILSAAGFILYLHENERHARPAIDIGGAALFTIAIGALMMALTDAGSADDSRAALELALFVVCALLFVWQERRAADPMISFSLWTHRPIAAANAATVFCGIALMGLTTFLPMYVQGVLQRSAVVAGFALTMIMVGWPSGATVAARTFNRLGLRRVLIGGSFFLPVGAIPFVLLNPESSPVLAGIGSLVMGFGMGTSSVCALVLIQEIVSPAERGSATASNLFSRNLGSTLGATVFGAVLNFGLRHSPYLPAGGADELRRVLDAPGGHVSADASVRLALQQSLHLTFLALLAVAIAVVVAMLFVPPVKIGRVAKVSASEAI